MIFKTAQETDYKCIGNEIGHYSKISKIRTIVLMDADNVILIRSN
jgi:hypothetical protein